ncbi:group II intron reverse transcriptase/maturase [Myxococcota bacterium]|nr:group II intron reverse transcriptase/maturase [Myxococcota bacterium]
MTKMKPFSISKRMVWAAFKAVRENKGAPGVDGQTIEEFEEDLGNNLYRIWNRLSSGAYFPPPVLRVEIPKRDGGVRKLGIPTVGDRVAQAVVKMYLEPIVERTFHPDSYGYRPGRSAHQAIEQARRRCWTHDWVLDLDIRSFFDSIDHALMLRAVKRFTDCRWVLLYVERWLKADVQLSCGRVEKRHRGTPQGGVASPVLANMFLHLAFDQWMAENFADVPFERYADDVVVHCRSKTQAQFIRDRIARRLQQCGLELHPRKTRVVCCRPHSPSSEARSFDFLGFTFQPRVARSKAGRLFTTFGPAISRAAANDVRRTIRRLWRLSQRTGMELNEIASLANPVLRGWINYYGRFRPSALVAVFRTLNLSLRRWVMRKYKRFKGRPRAAMRWLGDIAQRDRELFAHWKYPSLLPTVVAGR